MNKYRRGMLALLVCGVIASLSSETMIRVVDPLGGIRYYNDLSQQFAGFVVDDARGYAMYPGLYTFSNWSALIDRDGNRYTPATKDTVCTIAFAGDSLTWGFGVNDTETFVNLLAAQMDAHVSNIALSAYNSENVRRSIETTRADGYIVFYINNDEDVTRRYTDTLPRSAPDVLAGKSAIALYADVLVKKRWYTPQDIPRFRADVRAVAARDDVLIVAFADAAGWSTHVMTLAPDALLIPPYTHTNSYADPHPNAVGHQQIATSLLPYVQAFTARRCFAF